MLFSGIRFCFVRQQETNSLKTKMKKQNTNTDENQTAQTKPAWARTEVPINTVMRCLEAATPMFADSAVVSVNVQATFGLVEVRRNGQCFMVQEVAA